MEIRDFGHGAKVKVYTLGRKLCPEYLNLTDNSVKPYQATLIGTSEHIVNGKTTKHAILGWNENPFPSGLMPEEIQIDPLIPIRDPKGNYRYKAFVPLGTYCEAWPDDVSKKVEEEDSLNAILQAATETIRKAMADSKTVADSFLKAPAPLWTKFKHTIKDAQLGDTVRYAMRDGTTVEGTVIASSGNEDGGSMSLIGFQSALLLPKQDSDGQHYTVGDPRTRLRYYNHSVEEGKTYEASAAERIDTPCEINPPKRTKLAYAMLGDRVKVELAGKMVEGTVMGVKPSEGYVKSYVLIGFPDLKVLPKDAGYSIAPCSKWLAFESYVEGKERFAARKAMSFDTPCEILYSTIDDGSPLDMEAFKDYPVVSLSNADVVALKAKPIINVDTTITLAGAIGGEMPSTISIGNAGATDGINGYYTITNGSMSGTLNGLSSAFVGNPAGLTAATGLTGFTTQTQQTLADWALQTHPTPKVEEQAKPAIPEPKLEPESKLRLEDAKPGDMVIVRNGDDGAIIEGTVLVAACGYTLLGYKASQRDRWFGKTPAAKIVDTPEFISYYGSLPSNIKNYDYATSFPSHYECELVVVPETASKPETLSPLWVLGAALFAELMKPADKPKVAVRVAEAEVIEEVVEEAEHNANTG